MQSSRVLTTLAVVAIPLAVAMPVACRSPTQITLDVRTNANCTNAATWQGVSIYVGSPGTDVESRSPALTTHACQPGGEIGTLDVVPTGATDSETGIRVVAGITRNPEDCAANNYDGCIVARRTTTFEPHQTLLIVVDLTTDCTGLACDTAHTCTNGSCIDSHQVVVDTPTVTPTGPTVRCGDNAIRCATTGQVCCLESSADQKTATGSCKAVEDCAPKNAVLFCDDDSDCVGTPGDDGGGPAVCCLAGAGGFCNFAGTLAGGAQCVPASKCNGNVVLCEDRQPCRGGSLCSPTAPLPGYHSCCFQ